MERTYRVPFPRVGLVALLAALVLLAVPGTSHAGSASIESAAVVETGREPLARGAGYESPQGADRVRALQRTLRRLGRRPGPIDGLFGPLTEAAVVRFQRGAKLAADGMVGPRTSRALRQTERKRVALRARREERRARRAQSRVRRITQARVRSAVRRLLRVGVRPEVANGTTASPASGSRGLTGPVVLVLVVLVLVVAALLGQLLVARLTAGLAGPGTGSRGSSATPKRPSRREPVHSNTLAGARKRSDVPTKEVKGQLDGAKSEPKEVASPPRERSEPEMAIAGVGSSAMGAEQPASSADLAMAGIALFAQSGQRPTNDMERAGNGVASSAVGGARPTNDTERAGNGVASSAVGGARPTNGTTRPRTAWRRPRTRSPRRRDHRGWSAT